MVSCGMTRHRTTFHGLAVWKRARRVARIEAQYTCTRCSAYRPGKNQLHVHHKKPLAKAPALALEPLNFTVVCPGCHNAIEPRSGSPRLRSACNEQGYPLDPSHPWFRK